MMFFKCAADRLFPFRQQPGWPRMWHIGEQLNAARLRAALAATGDLEADFVAPAGADPILVSTHRQLLLNQVNEHRAKVASLARQQAQKEAEQATIGATIHKLEATIPVVQQRVDIRKTLMEKELTSKIVYFEILQLLVEQQEELSVQKSHLTEAEAAVAAIRETRGQAVAEFRKSLSDELAKAEQKANGLTQDLIKAERKTTLQRLTAPVDGVVQQLAIHTVGGVVTPAQALMVIVPNDSRLEIEAMVSNRDIGFIHTGQEAQIKIDTFNFTRYGLLQGEVLSVSQDAIIRDQPQDRSGDRRVLRRRAFCLLQALGNGMATKWSPSAVWIRISTAFLPSCLALAISDFTSAGVDTDLPATSRMTSPAFSPLAAASPFGSTLTMATPFPPAPVT